MYQAIICRRRFFPSIPLRLLLALLLLATTLGLLPAVQVTPLAELVGPAASSPDGLAAADWATMREMMRAAQYQVTWQTRDGEWAYRAPNRAQGFSVAFASDGFLATGYEADGAVVAGGGVAWEFGLAPVGYDAPVELSADKTRVEYRWDDTLTEWYENRADGVEHGLTLAAPPAGSDGSEVELTFALHGSLTPDLEATGQALRLRDAAGVVVLLYDQLHVYDAQGRTLPANFSLSQGEASLLHIHVEAAGAIYPITVDPLLTSQVAILRATDAQAYDHFGWAVSVSEDMVVVGAYVEDGGAGARAWGAGAAYIYERNQGGADNWGQVAILRATDAQAWDYFGGAVSISGDTVVVGAPGEDGGAGDPISDAGAAYVYERNSDGAGGTAADGWGQVAILRASDAQARDRFGGASISGDTVVVGACQEDGGAGDPMGNAGAVYVYERNQGGADNWGQVAKLTASDAQAEDYFGWSVAISGDTVVVGARWEDGGAGDPLSEAGAAYIYERNQGGADNWGQVAILRATDAQVDDLFGLAVSISGGTVVVGARYEDGGSGDPMGEAGAAYVYERNQGGADNWGQVVILRATDTQARDWFGHAVSISGDTIVVGACQEDGGAGDPISRAGAAYTYVRSGNSWPQTAEPTASDAQADDQFGYSVAISGDTVIVGAYGEDGGAGDPISDAGAAYVYERNGDGAGGTVAEGWGQVTKLTASDAQVGDNFGYAVSISGDMVVVGAIYEDGGAGDPLSDAGAAYVYERNSDGAGGTAADGWGQVAILRATDAQALDYFGYALAIGGGTVVVGARYEDGGVGDPMADAGAAYVYKRNSDGAGGTAAGNWGRVAILRASDAQARDWFGHAVSISGDTIVVGACREDGGTGDPLTNAGAAYIYERNSDGAGGTAADNWGQVAILRATDAQALDNFGCAVSISGGTVVVGARYEDGSAGDPLSDAGAAYVYERNQGGADNWGQVAKLTVSDAQVGDQFGYAVAISGDTVAVGARWEDGGAGDPSSKAGAAYVYWLTQLQPELTLAKSVDDATPDPGQTITYTITITNDGDAEATGALVSDMLPGGLTFAGPVGLEGSAGTVATGAGDLPILASGLTISVGGRVTVTWPVSVNTVVAGGTIITNTAEVTSMEVTTPATGWVQVTVNNIPPLFASTPVTTADAGLVYTCAISATDANTSDVLAITAPTLPGWLSLTDQGNRTATLTGTPLEGDLGDHGVVLQVEDSGSLSDTQSFTITVTYTPPAIVYVDTALGTDDLAHGTAPGAAAFRTIGYAIDHVTLSGTVYVAAGTYDEQIIVDKSLAMHSGSSDAVYDSAAIIDGGGAGTALTVAASDVTIVGFTIQNANVGVSVGSGAGVQLCFNNIISNTNYGLYAGAAVTDTVDAENNWWGDASGPTHPDNPAGTGTTVSDKVDYDPWLGAAVKGSKSRDTQTGLDQVDARDEADALVEKAGDGTPTVSLAKYAGNPADDFPGDVGKYYGLRVDYVTDVISMTVRLYFTLAEIAGWNPNSLTTLYWDGDSWEECSDQVLHLGAVNGYAGYIEVTITNSTSPSLSDLTGSEFALSGLRQMWLPLILRGI